MWKHDVNIQAIATPNRDFLPKENKKKTIRGIAECHGAVVRLLFCSETRDQTSLTAVFQYFK